MVSVVVLAAVPGALLAQHADSAQHLAGMNVTVTRTQVPLRGLGASVSIVDSAAIHRGHLSTALDEALAFVPGVIVQNRGNYSLDERLSIRGFGARANFGLRGVKVVLDGVPQTLPDGQSQLNNLDLALVNHVEVMRGGASSLYGNAAGGVVAFSTVAAPATPWLATAAFEAGTFGTNKTEVTLGGRSGRLGGTIAVSRFATDGYRQQSATEQQRLNAAADWAASGSTTVTVRLSSADDPHARNPGALTASELAANPDSAAAGNIRRGADKSVTQSQLAVGLHHEADRWQVDATAYGLVRNLANPLATPPPAPAAANEGTWSGIDRALGGARLSVTTRVGPPTITAGLDAQALRDDRVNKRSVGGIATDTVLVDQRERVGEGALFVQLSWPLTTTVTARAGGRRDLNQFSVADHLLSDGDASGSRTMHANSGNIGLAWVFDRSSTIWSSVATVFQTPTTTELANRPDGGGGFNPDLNPERSVTAEIGMRTTRGPLRAELSAYRTSTRDAIVPYSDVGGRSYYRNAGQTRTRGAEAGVTLALTPRLLVTGTWTLTDATFTDYGVVNGTNVDTLTGKALAGIPRQVAHLGLQGTIGHDWTMDIDQAWSAALFGDDDNTIRVAGWGMGVTGVRVGWVVRMQRATWHPFVTVLNLFDRQYVGSVTIDGAAGRVFEPAPGRTISVGSSISLH
jgi:iron complex outermembrane receptor protein